MKLTNNYISSIESSNQDSLIKFQQRMTNYYISSPYHDSYIKGINAKWQEGVHNPQIQMCSMIPANSSILEVGCGDGSCAREIISLVENCSYTGVDLDENMWKSRTDFNFIAATADNLPFSINSFDVVLSMFVIEHLVFPSRFIDEAWRVLKPGGLFITIAPDFDRNAMASERIGLSYGSGKEKIAKGRLLDALLTFYDSKLRLPLIRRQRRKKLKSHSFCFPIFSDPNCLKLDGFTPDCDAVYPCTYQEIENYIMIKKDYESSELFYHDAYNFGLKIIKSKSS